MYVKTGFIVALIIHIQIVQSQNEVAFGKVTNLPYQCYKEMELKCTYTGSNAWDSNSNRIWRVNGSVVMSNGEETLTVKGKYKEGQIDTIEKSFILIIKKLEKADLSQKYSCRYAAEELLTASPIGSFCICFDCCMKVLLYLGLGTLIWLIVNFIGKVIKECSFQFLCKDWKIWLAALDWYIIVSLFLNHIIAGLTGTYGCQCLNGNGPYYILVGIGTGIVASANAYCFFYIFKFKKLLFGPLLILTTVEAIGIGLFDFLIIANLFKGQCNVCGGRSFGWAVCGIVITVFVIFFLFKCIKKLNYQRSFIFSALILGRSLVVHVVVTVPIGIYLCPCSDWTSLVFIASGFVYSMILLCAYWPLLDEENDMDLISLLTFGGLGIGSSLICAAFFFKVIREVFGSISTWQRCVLVVLVLPIGTVPILLCIWFIYKRCVFKKAVEGSDVELQCPKMDAHTKKDKIAWFKCGDPPAQYSKGKEILSNLPEQLRSRLTITENYDLKISDVTKEDKGTYECAFSGEPGTGSRLQLTVTSGKSQSVESGSSCWPICRVGQDPNTSSSGPEKVRRSPEKERADKKKERKPTEVVRPQPSRPLPSRAQHLKTDNTGREEYSAENELFKPRPLPSISGHSDSPRPLPKRTPDDQLEKGGIQLEPLVDSTSEKKKKKKRKKKETKQSDEDD